MKRVTVQVTVADEYYLPPGHLRKVKAAMINAAVAKATELDLSIMALDTKVGHVREVKRK